jgi:hypothetical protein
VHRQASSVRTLMGKSSRCFVLRAVDEIFIGPRKAEGQDN